MTCLPTLTPVGKHRPCSGRRARPGSVAAATAPVLPTRRRLQPLQHLLPGEATAAGQGKFMGHFNTILLAPDCPYLCLSSIPIQEISFSDMLILLFSPLFLSALPLLLFFSTVFLPFGVSGIRYEALCLTILPVCKRHLRFARA